MKVFADDAPERAAAKLFLGDERVVLIGIAVGAVREEPFGFEPPYHGGERIEMGLRFGIKLLQLFDEQGAPFPETGHDFFFSACQFFHGCASFCGLPGAVSGGWPVPGIHVAETRLPWCSRSYGTKITKRILCATNVFSF